MPHSVGLDVSQETTAICVVDAEGRRVCRGTSPTNPGSISQLMSKHAGAGVKLGVETGAITLWLVHGLRAAGSQSLPRRNQIVRHEQDGRVASGEVWATARQGTSVNNVPSLQGEMALPEQSHVTSSMFPTVSSDEASCSPS